MKKISNALFVILAFLLLGCEGSETYRGKWKATEASGAKFELFFDAENLIIKDSLGKKATFKYSQNSVNINNSVETYGIKLDDGRGYQIHFPIADDENTGFISDEIGNPIFTISRTKFMTSEDIYKLK